MTVKPIRKLINFEIKNINDNERAFDAIASTEAIDRDGDILRAAGWKLKNYRKNPTVLWAHNYGAFPIAKSVKIKIEDNKLIFRPQFATKEQNPIADQAYQLYKGGFLRTFSVGFMPKKWEPREDENYPYGREYKEQELLEISGCPVPSNPEALGQAAVKSLLENTLEGILGNSNKAKGGIIEGDWTTCEKCGCKFDFTKESDLEIEFAMTIKECPDCGTMLDQTGKEIKQKYNCECIKCGHKMKSDKHCKDIKCSECGGQMRRVERPGPGQEYYDEGKSGRVLSEKNRTLIKSCVTQMKTSIDLLIELIEATEVEQDSESEALIKAFGDLKETISKI